MAAFDFPNSPSLNDTYAANGFTYKWNGTKWVRSSPSIGAQGGTGPTGAQGAAGAQGNAGAQGATGSTGPSGSATISNNADDRVITGGSGTNLVAESTMTYTSSLLKLATASSTSTDAELLHLVGGGTADRGLKIGTGRATGASQNHAAAIYDAINSESSGYGSQHRFKIAGTDCFTIGYNGDFGYVGINDTIPYPDAVSGNTVNTCLELGSPSGTDTSSVIKLIGRQGDGTLNKCQIQWAGANNRFDITVNGNQALQIQANKDVEVTDGDLVIGTSGHGINFGATGDGTGSSQAEILDDYEEGTWSPTVSSGNASFSTLIGRYTKIGNQVTLWVRIAGGGSYSGSSALIIQGLPFTNNTPFNPIGTSEYYKILFGNGFSDHCTPYLAGQNLQWLRNGSSGGSGNYLTVDLFYSGAAIQTVLTYMTNS